jgi:hypothetical protein
MPVWGDLTILWRFMRGLRGFLKKPITLEQSQEIIKQRLQNRSQNLLSLVKRAVYENKTSPYLKLLEIAGCEYGDFERMVLADGIETALGRLAGEKVYISTEEFKGKKEVIRSGKTFLFKETDFDNPFLSGQLAARSSGSRSAGTRTLYEFDHLLASGMLYRSVLIDAYDIYKLPFALWWAIMPGAGPIIVLASAKIGKSPLRWFSPVEKRGFRPSLKNRAGTEFIIYAGRLMGARMPRPEYVSADEAWRVAEWMAKIISQKGGCRFFTYPSLAVRICQAAKEKGIDLTGIKFFLTGEPLTYAKQKEVASVGATTCSVYAFTEAGIVGLGCPEPAVLGDVHLCQDSFALIQQPRSVPHASTSVDAFLCTTLLSSSPKILLNAESGDWGVIETRNCGCKFGKLGLNQHLYNIRGFDKLTGEGMTFIGTDLVKIMEEVLPAKFGGASTDYQMLEEEDEKGLTHMSMLVSPKLGPIDESDMINTILTELSQGTDSQRMMTNVWAQAGTLQIKRTQPYTTAGGKLMPLHIRKSG